MAAQTIRSRCSVVAGSLASIIGHLPSRAPRLAAMVIFVLSLVAAAGVEPRVTTLPPDLVASLGLSPFYQKFTSARGLPVLSSSRVSDYALLEAAYLIDQMLAGRQDIRTAMISNKVRFVVMAVDEFTTAVPEHSTLEPGKFWDKRARGLGATHARPVVSCGEENLLGYRGDPYAVENILVHEFSHAIHQMGLKSVDPSFDERLRKAYKDARSADRWQGTYAATNPGEYWAEGVQSWFDTNRENDAQHNHVNTREELMEYDPALAELIREVFGDRPWRYRKPFQRPTGDSPHLAGLEITNAPAFAWPPALLEWNQQYAANINKPESELVNLQLKPPITKAVSEPVSTLRDTSILFINNRTNLVALYRLNSKGGRRLAGKLAPGEKRRHPTHAGQTWLISEPPEKALGVVVATAEPGKVNLDSSLREDNNRNP